MATSLEIAIVDKFEEAQDSLVLQSSDLSLETIAQMVDSGAIDVSPHYQRRERWKTVAQAELIESFLLNVPVPPVYLAEDDFGTYSVIDGKQRITAIHGFLRNKYPLTKLIRFPEVNGLAFEKLPKSLRNALSIRPYIRVVTLLKQTNPELKYEVFTRLNTGGEPLLPQEIRNALYRGPLNELLFELAEEEFLLDQLKIKTKHEAAYTEMTDVEVVLRYFSLRNQWENFNGDSRRTMDDFMDKHRKLSKKELAELKSSFIKALSRCQKLWGNNAFHRFADNKFRDQFLASMYDAEMIAVSELSVAAFNKLLPKKAAVIAETKKLFKDNKFEEAVRVSTNTPSRVRYRIEKVMEMLSAI
jgi:hypothetical protein